jgi:type IV pilus assembly protein PilF
MDRPLPSSACRRATLRGVATTMLAGFGLGACASSGGPHHPAQSESAQSAAELDLAADLWLRRGQPRQALEHALRAVALDDENAQANHLVALLYLDFCRRNTDECRLADAERHARAAFQEDANLREARNTLGVILVHQQKYAEAIEVLRPLTGDILYQTPENAWGNLGWAYLESEQIAPAIDALSRSVAVQPRFCVGYYRLGLAYERAGKDRAAQDALTRALSVDDARCRGMQVAYQARSRVATRLGRQDESRSDLEQCVHLDKASAAGRECASRLNRMK